MATLVLTTIGTAIGGPLGGALGALLGQAADARVFAPKGRTGARLSDLRVQTSSYGAAIPRILGRMRVSGTVIWATDLVEHRNRNGNGKGRPSTTTFSYSASFAVALSSRPIVDVGRIWAEGNVFRGADGVFKSSTAFRLYTGDEDQPIDPLIASAEGINGCPAYRGIAYAVFEDMDLAPFGNRIPSLSFEVIGDSGPIALGDVAADAIGAAQQLAATPAIIGYVHAGSSRRDAAEQLLRLVRIARRADTGLWQVGEDALAPPSNIGEAVVSEQGNRLRHVFAAAGQRPTAIAMGHFDPERDFQTSRQSARVAGGTGTAEQIELALAAQAPTIKAIVRTLSVSAAQGHAQSDRPCGFAALCAPIGSRVSSIDSAGQVATARVTERRIEGGSVVLQLDGSPPTLWLDAENADGGRSIAAPDQTIGSTVGYVFDVPSWDGATMGMGFSGGPVVAATGTGAGWRSATVEMRAGAGLPLTTLGAIGASPVLGHVTMVAAESQSVLIDRIGMIEVELLRDDMLLNNASEQDLFIGANVAMIGNEVIQFGRAQPLGNRRWRLSQLLRGRAGTEGAMAATAVGSSLVLVSPTTLFALPSTIGLSPLVPGAEVMLSGISDAAPLAIAVPHDSQTLVPLPPVHMGTDWASDGSLAIRWVRRSRAGFAWLDSVDAPIGEREERYQVTLSIGSLERFDSVATPQLTLVPADVIALRAHGNALSVVITQIGELGASTALSGNITI